MPVLSIGSRKGLSMNKLYIIGNLVKDPELRTTQSGISVCSFTVAVNRRGRKDQQETDYFRVNAWRELGEVCAKWLVKGKKVAVLGQVSANAYQGRDGKAYASLEVLANEVEFLSPAGQVENEQEKKVDQQTGLERVEDDDLPF